MESDSQEKDKAQQRKRHKGHVKPVCHSQSSVPGERQYKDGCSGQQRQPPGQSGQKTGTQSREIPRQNRFVPSAFAYHVGQAGGKGGKSGPCGNNGNTGQQKYEIELNQLPEIFI